MTRFYQGRFTPKYPEKYVGDPTNIIYRSSWEFSFLTWVDANPNVLRYASEELYIPYYFVGDSKWHRYYPDFLLQVRTKENQFQTWLVEIKPYRQTLHPNIRRTKTPKQQLKESMEYAKNRSKWEAASAFCRDKGWRFVVVTEKDLYPTTPKK